MAVWRKWGNTGRRVDFIGAPLGITCIVVFIVLAAGDAFWLVTDGTWRFHPAAANKDTLSASERLAVQQHAKAASIIKPTVTAEMGDVGGTYFGKPPDPARTRHYYIAAEPEQWDFMPGGSDLVCGMPVPPAVAAKHVVWKARYFEYTDGTFTKRVPETERLGILGPVLRGVVGEYIEVTFLNRARGGVFSMHPHGVKYDKDSEGSYHRDSITPLPTIKDAGGSVSSISQGRGAALGYGARFTYVWYCDESSGPLPSEPSSKAWLYHSHVSSGKDINLGLEGFIIVTDPARARPDGTPKDVDREIAALFMIFDESGIGEEAAEQGTGPFDSRQWAYLQNTREQGQRHAINGYIFGSLPGLEMNEGERVRWYLFGLGSEEDLHTAHWHGLRVIEDGRRRTDVVELLPASMKTADMVADDPGSWLFHCHVEEHMAGGMFARVTVHPKDKPGASRVPEKAFFGLKSTNPLVVP